MSGLCDSTCIKCKHVISYRGYGVGSGMHCNYLIDTGHPRGCPAGKGCTKREVSKGGRPKKTEETKNRS